MRLLRDLFASAPRSAAALVAVLVGGAVGQASASALAGQVLIGRSMPLFAVLALALLTSVICRISAGLISARLTATWSGSLRRRLTHAAFGQPLHTLEGTPVGELLDRIDNDVYDIGSQVRGPLLRLATMAAIGLASLVAATLVWWPVGLAAVLLFALLILVLRGPVSQIGPARLHEEEAWSDMAAVTEEAIHGQDDVRTSLAQPYVMQLYAQSASEVLRRGSVVWRRSAQIGTTSTVTVHLALAGFVLGGVWALANGRVDSARLTSLWLLSLSMAMIAVGIARQIPEVQSALGAWTRIQLLAGAEQEPSGGHTPRTGPLEIRDLSFEYDDEPDGVRPRRVLRGVSLTFQPGRSYALIGRTGSGKSTLAKLLTRAVEPPVGTVFLAGTDLTELDLAALRRHVALLPQFTDIVAGTVAENLTLYDPDLRGRAEQVIADLGLADWVAELPEGMNTRLGSGGDYVLSAGQEQLLAFARILLRRPAVVVLDEATARLDPGTEAQVQRALGRLLEGRIGIIIAHRLSTVRDCDEVVVLADGQVIEAGPLASSVHFAAWSALGHLDDETPDSLPGNDVHAGEPHIGPDGAARRPDVVRAADGESGQGGVAVQERVGAETSVEPAVPAPRMPAEQQPDEPAPQVRPLREVLRLAVNDPRYGLASVGIWTMLAIFGLEGAVLPALWADLVTGGTDVADLWVPALLLVVVLLATSFEGYFTNQWFPRWWVLQMERIGSRLVYGQTGPKRRSTHTPGEVVAQAGDTERVVIMADNLVDIFTSLVVTVAMVVVARSFTPSLIFAAAVGLSALAASAFGRRLARAARRTVSSRAAFATALASCLGASRTIKLAGADASVLAHLMRLDAERNERQRREIAIQVWARSVPRALTGLLPLLAWALYLSDRLDSTGLLITISVLGAAEWFAWTAASLVSAIPSARVWTARTVAMSGESAYSISVPGVDLEAGTAPAPPVRTREALVELRLDDVSAVHEDGTVGVRDVDLTVRRGELVLVVGAVASGKSSLLRALAGLVPHTGTISWNGAPVRHPEVFLRPDQVGYVAQLPRVLSGTVAENIALGHHLDLDDAITTAQLDHDLDRAGQGVALRVGHKGTRLSGGQVQRLALARALAPQSELLIADDISSALDVTTELALWQAVREHGTTVIGSTSKRAALALADRVLVLDDGRAVAQGTWAELEPRWSHLAG